MLAHNSKQLQQTRGFTLVEMLIVAPIVILMIGGFISAIISMTGDVLRERAGNNLSYSIQDALNTIDQDVRLGGGFLAKNNITPTSPQGYDNATSNFQNVGSADGAMLILDSYATTASPVSSAWSRVYKKTPNACGSPSTSLNGSMGLNIIYFIKDDTLWRRVLAPSDYDTSGCSIPWQKPTCALAFIGGFCAAEDMKLVEGVNSFSIEYYTKLNTVDKISNAVNGSLADAERQTALDTANSIKVSINATQTVAGKGVSQSGTIRAIDATSNDLATLSNAGGGKWAYRRPITITNSSGAALTDYQVSISLTTTSLGNPYTHIKTDGSDIRFTDLAVPKEYSYWRESWNISGTSTVWVKIPSLPTGSTTINMYYGNPSAISSSNGDNTFIFFDDFESGNLNKWNSKTGTPKIGPAYAYSGSYGGYTSSTSCNENSLNHKFSPTAVTSVIAEYKRRIANGYSYGGISGPLGTDARYIGAALGSPTSYTIYDSAYNAATSASVTTWRRYKVSASPTDTKYYTDGLQIPYTTNRAGTFSNIILYSCSAGGYSYFDDVIVRQYASTEPTHTAPGAEIAL